MASPIPVTLGTGYSVSRTTIGEGCGLMGVVLDGVYTSNTRDRIYSVSRTTIGEGCGLMSVVLDGAYTSNTRDRIFCVQDYRLVGCGFSDQL